MQEKFSVLKKKKKKKKKKNRLKTDVIRQKKKSEQDSGLCVAIAFFSEDYLPIQL